MDAGSVVDGRYEVCRPLSVTGGMGDVYLCLDRKLNRQVAVKLIKPEHANKPEYRERFQREVDSAIALEGYDVVRVHEYGECAVLHAPYCVMEYLRGRDVRQELAARGPFELSRALEILLDVCRVIGAAHARGIVHRDLKPSNLFLEGPPSPRRSVRVLDFGIARIVGDPRDGALTQLSGQPGSPNYMSPEQHKNELQVGIQADIWALGAVLFEMVVGEKAWPGESYEARQRALEDAAPHVRTSRPELPNELDRIIHKCLEKDPAARYASVRELEEDLRALQSAQQNTSETIPTFVTTAQRRTSLRAYRLPWILAFGALSLLVVALLGARSWRQQAILPGPGGDQNHPSTEAPAKALTKVASPPLANTREAERGSATIPASLASTQSDGSSPPTTDVSSPASDGQAKKATRARRVLPAASASATSLTPQAPAPIAPKLYRNETRLKTK